MRYSARARGMKMTVGMAVITIGLVDHPRVVAVGSPTVACRTGKGRLRHSIAICRVQGLTVVGMVKAVRMIPRLA